VTLSVSVVTIAMPPVTVLEKGQCDDSVQMTEHLTGYLTVIAIGAGIFAGVIEGCVKASLRLPELPPNVRVWGQTDHGQSILSILTILFYL